MALEQVAFDIETTGFDANDEVTVIGFGLSMGVRVMVQTGGRSPSDVEAVVEAATKTLVNVSIHPSERAVLAAVADFVERRLHDEDILLVAYNGERWNGGFDLPFLRTRYAQLDIAWPFEDVPYADLLPLVSDRFNTTVDGEEYGDLATAYAVLGDGTHGDHDPFDESAEAVTAFEDGRFADLAVHNVADVLRTRELGQVAERYCAKSEFQIKSLTPTRST
ncbi:Uncharacterized protein HSRCO_1531 [Halanaeroarchaeum sp. HSR-CO]|uniref:ribonuclease H-like domain-containing protein n=1 Tax=Halanaeroarchaeum sp. HSR-CO TaxID=2866382 RepID=UPI00217E587A|nr:ribonuclease H-like domain-containing protein [Halanaeroarchaeum sp. HSR-CO]UWG47812.1 Uncharacterized protein HSRCO_1531 [Halanaeroarchaeum sp. HSR-CO]